MRCKNSLFLLLAFTLAVVALAGCGGSGSRVGSGSGLTSAPALGASNQVGALAAEVEAADALQVNADGTVALKPESSRAAKLSPEAEAFAQKALSELNPMVRAGKVRVANDLSVRPTGVEPRLPQYVGRRWWGIVFYFPHKDIEMGVANTIARTSLGLTTGLNGKMLLVTGPIWAALSYADGSNGNRGAYLYVTWVLVWAAGPTAG